MLDEWVDENFDEWDLPSFQIESEHLIEDNTVSVKSPGPISGQSRGPFPEVEIRSSSDEDAPPIPESTQLARENHQLRERIKKLSEQSKNVERDNNTLKIQLQRCRNIFQNQMKSSIRSIFH